MQALVLQSTTASCRQSYWATLAAGAKWVCARLLCHTMALCHTGSSYHAVTTCNNCTAAGDDLSEVTSSPAMDGGIPTRGGPSRMACPAEEGGESPLAAAKEAPALLRGRPASMHSKQCYKQGSSHAKSVTQSAVHVVAGDMRQSRHTWL